MPIVAPGAKVLVTGANGFVASWLIKTLLSKGYSVRGTVRSPSKGEYLTNTLFKDAGSKFELSIVQDITADGAFDEAVKGVDIIQHTASPFQFKSQDPKDFLVPAINGTLSVLKSASKVSSVKRVIVTSSCASILEDLPAPKIFIELDWNTQSVEDVEKNGFGASAASKYRASKTLAERAAWDFYKENKSSLSWDLTVLNPPYIFGPVIHEVASQAELNTSALDMYNTLIRGTRTTRQQLLFNSGWIDVRDLAEAFVLAQETEAAGGERIIVAAGAYIWQDWINTANKIKATKHVLPKGIPELSDNVVYFIDYSMEKERRIFGGKLKYTPMEDCIRDTLQDFEKRGW